MAQLWLTWKSSESHLNYHRSLGMGKGDSEPYKYNSNYNSHQIRP